MSSSLLEIINVLNQNKDLIDVQDKIKNSIDAILDGLSDFEKYTLGNALFTYSINLNSINMLNFSLERFKINNLFANPLTIACENGNLEIVSILLNHPDINLYSKSSLDKIYSVIRDINIEEKEPLYIAIKAKNVELIKLLLTRVDPRRHDNLALKLSEGNEEITLLINNWIKNNDTIQESENQEQNQLETKIINFIDYAKNLYYSFTR